MNSGLAEMFRYNAWANRELFEACRSLTEEQLDMRIRGISGSVRELLMHIAGGQQTFVLRTKGRQHEGELGRQSNWPGIEKVIHIVMSTSDELIAIAEQLDDDEDVNLPYQGKTYRYPKRFFLVHAMEHSTEHRTEVKIALAQLVVCWLNNARNSLPGLAEHGSVGHLPKMGDEPCVVASQRNFS